MELSRIKILVDKYFDGVTSLEEEQELTRALNECHDLPEEYATVKMMLLSFATLKQETAPSQAEVTVDKSHRKWLNINTRWIATAAAAACIMLGTALIFTHHSSNTHTTEPDYVCYMNGVKIENDQMAYAEASRILGNISEDLQIAMMEVNRLTHYTIVK